MSTIIVFDVDGTLFDTKIGILHAFNYVLEKRGYPPIEEEQVDKLIGPSVREIFKEYYGMDGSQAEEATVEYRNSYISQFIQESELYVGWDKTLMILRNSGVILGIATMKTQPQINALLKLKGMENIFDIAIGAKEDGTLSKKMMLEAIRRRYGEAHRYFMIGDTNGDFEASQANKYAFVFCEFGFGRLADEVCAASIKKPEELVGLIM